MYLHTSPALGQAELPSAYGTPCLQDDVKQRVEAALLSDNVSKNLDQFVFKSPKLLAWHRTWIKRQFVPAIVKSFLTDKPIKTIILVGDADEIGTPARNYKLGKDRAEAVREELKTQLNLASRGVAAKVTMEVFSRGECWPVVKSGKKEARNRRVEVFGVRAAAPATKTQPAPDPGQTPKPAKVPDIWKIPDKTKKEIEEKDRQALEQRRYDPIPPLPKGKSLRDWLNEKLWWVPKVLRKAIVDAVVTGACTGLGALLDQAGMSNAEKEGVIAMCKAVAQGKYPRQ
jgi:hypothetical protein